MGKSLEEKVLAYMYQNKTGYQDLLRARGRDSAVSVYYVHVHVHVIHQRAVEK